MTLAFGLRHIIIDETRSKDLRDSKYLGNTAILLGKPAITTESGFLGKTDEESIDYLINTPPANRGSPLFEVGRVKGAE